MRRAQDMTKDHQALEAGISQELSRLHAVLCWHQNQIHIGGPKDLQNQVIFSKK
jgi:hypothetical protein